MPAVMLYRCGRWCESHPRAEGGCSATQLHRATSARRPTGFCPRQAVALHARAEAGHPPRRPREALKGPPARRERGRGQQEQLHVFRNTRTTIDTAKPYKLRAMATSLLVALWSPLTRPYHGKKVTPPWVGPLIGHERGPQGTDLDENFGTPYSLTRRIRK